MKKFSLLFVSALLAVCSVNAEVLLVEDFDYKPESALLIQNGWFDQWGNNTSTMSVTTGLVMENHPNSNIGSAALLDKKSDQPLHKKFSKQVTDGSCYYSFLFQYSNISKKGWFMALRDDKITPQDFNMDARVIIGNTGDLAVTFANNQKAVFSEKKLEAGKTYLIVVKYTIKAGDNNDEVSIFAFDDYASAQKEPAMALAGPVGDSAEKDINPAHFVLRGHDNNSSLMIDAIRVGTSWGDVVPAAGGTALELNKFSHNIYSVEGGIELDLDENVNVVNVFDCMGKSVYVNNNAPANCQIALNNGIYIVCVNGESNKVIVR